MSAVPSWDMFLGIFVVISVVYGFILQRERVLTTLLSIYMALLITNTWWESLYNFFQGDKTLGGLWIKSGASPFLVQLIMFLGIITLVNAKASVGLSRGGKGLLSPFEIIAYSVLNAALMVSAAVSFMPDEMKKGVLEASKFIPKIVQYQTLLLILPILLLIFITSRRSDY